MSSSKSLLRKLLDPRVTLARVTHYNISPDLHHPPATTLCAATIAALISSALGGAHHTEEVRRRAAEVVRLALEAPTASCDGVS